MLQKFGVPAGKANAPQMPPEDSIQVPACDAEQFGCACLGQIRFRLAFTLCSCNHVETLNQETDIVQAKNSNKRIFAERLAHLLERQGVTQQEVADDLGIPQSAVSSYLAGRMPRADRLAELARFFDVPADYLLGREYPQSGQDHEAALDTSRDTEEQRIKDAAAAGRVKAAALKAHAEWMKRGSADVTEAEVERGWIDTTPLYRTACAPSGLPKKIRLSRPRPSQAVKLVRTILKGDYDDLEILKACLPADLRTDFFLDKLNPFALEELVLAASSLVLGQPTPYNVRPDKKKEQ
ncbi:MAG: helix-turn-helix domain-containing protein [Verrucomicrobiales bacterium]|nr:helix-turn-helix domain-containing protein [Verrucomicrobiales bacterium]